jgi:hypothetical protein
MSDLIQVHVAWNDEFGNPDRLVGVEFTSDCETCAVETDVLDGDIIQVFPENSFCVFDRHIDKENKRPAARFHFENRVTWVGNIMWDMLWMKPLHAGQFAEWLQKQRHWSLNVAATELWNVWGDLSGEEFVKILRELESANGET